MQAADADADEDLTWFWQREWHDEVHAAPEESPRKIFSKRGRVRPPYNPSLEKFWHQRRRLFSRYDYGVKLDAEGWFSVTPEAVAAHTARRLLAGAPGGGGGPVCFIDAFAGVGGNAIQQCLADPHGVVVAVDIDPIKVSMARHNARLYGCDRRIEFVVGDFVSLAPRLRGHICFLSPPWGGISDDGERPFRLSDLELRGDRSTSADAAAGADAGESQGGGASLFALCCRVAPSVGCYLPHDTDASEAAALALVHPSRACELQTLVWGGGAWDGRHPPQAAAPKPSKRGARPRALLACYDASGEVARGAHATTVHVQ